MLSNEEIKRYSRHLIMPEVGIKGQQKLKDARVLCVGAGGLGSPLTMYLAAAGVGKIGLVDNDVVDCSNLQRQVLHYTTDVGRSKVLSAAGKLRALNPEIEIETYETLLSSDNALDICKRYDVVADGTDNFSTRYLTNDACVLLGKPNVHASVFRFEGQASVFYAKQGPCYRCLYPEPPPPGEVPSCAEGGVFGILPGLLGVIQATEVLKLLMGVGSTLIGRMLMFDALEMRFRELKFVKNPNCPMCGNNPTIKELVDYETFCEYVRTEQMSVEIDPVDVLMLMNDPSKKLTLLDVRDPHEWDICKIPGAKCISLNELMQNLHELDPEDDIVVYCLSGGRSRKAVALLREAGYKKLRNLSGGIRSWAKSVDHKMPIY
jgi:adenylyltransferase/sulfurtransferase